MSNSNTADYIVGVDLGGTNVRAAVTDIEGYILGQGRRPSMAMEAPEVTISQIIQSIRDAMSAAGIKDHDIRGIGMGVPGRHNSKQGVVMWSPNFRDMWAGVQVLAPIKEEFGVPAYMGNDANVAALGEFRFGAARDVNSMVMMTLGTGIGGGIILDGKLWLGANEAGGEVGQQIVNPGGMKCGCGNIGDLEGEARRDTIVERAVRKIFLGRKTILTDMVPPKFYDLTPAMIADAANKGDEVALEVMEETGFYVGLGVTNLISILNPDMVVIGGGISQAGDALWGPIMRTVRANGLTQALEVCQVVPAQLGDDAGIMGGVVLALQELEQ